MQFYVSDAELISIIHSGKRLQNGLLIIEIPDSLLEENASSRMCLSFCGSSNTVNSEKLSCRLSPLEFSLLKFVYENQGSGYEKLQDTIWKRPASDNAVRLSITKINSKLFAAGFSVELISRKSRVYLEKIS